MKSFLLIPIGVITAISNLVALVAEEPSVTPLNPQIPPESISCTSDVGNDTITNDSIQAEEGSASRCMMNSDIEEDIDTELEPLLEQSSGLRNRKSVSSESKSVAYSSKATPLDRSSTELPDQKLHSVIAATKEKAPADTFKKRDVDISLTLQDFRKTLEDKLKKIASAPKKNLLTNISRLKHRPEEELNKRLILKKTQSGQPVIVSSEDQNSSTEISNNENREILAVLQRIVPSRAADDLLWYSKTPGEAIAPLTYTKLHAILTCIDAEIAKEHDISLNTAINSEKNRDQVINKKAHRLEPERYNPISDGNVITRIDQELNTTLEGSPLSSLQEANAKSQLSFFDQQKLNQASNKESLATTLREQSLIKDSESFSWQDNQLSREKIESLPSPTIIANTIIDDPRLNQKNRITIWTGTPIPNQPPYALRREEIIDATTGSIINRQEMIANDLLITFRETGFQEENTPAQLQSILAAEFPNISFSLNRISSKKPLYQLRFNPHSSEKVDPSYQPSFLSLLPDLLRKVRADASVRLCDPNYLSSLDTIPNNQYFMSYPGDLPGHPGQWSLQGTHGINAVQAWETQSDASTVIVAVIDTGINANHSNFNTHNLISPKKDEDGHGSHVAGIIGAAGNQQIGISGVAWDIKLMSLYSGQYQQIPTIINNQTSCSVEWRGDTLTTIKSIEYACSHGATIINCSFGGAPASETMYEAFRDAHVPGNPNQKIIFVASAGNDSLDNDTNPHYPSSYSINGHFPNGIRYEKLDNIIAVAATTPTGELANFSHHGVRSVHLGAPGKDIYSIGLNDPDNPGKARYQNRYPNTLPIENPYNEHWLASGTSMAAPHVAGALALVKARFPNLDYQQVIIRLCKTADKITSLHGKVMSGNRLNLAAALDFIPSFTINAWSHITQSMTAFNAVATKEHLKTIQQGLRLFSDRLASFMKKKSLAIAIFPNRLLTLLRLQTTALSPFEHMIQSYHQLSRIIQTTNWLIDIALDPEACVHEELHQRTLALGAGGAAIGGFTGSVGGPVGALIGAGIGASIGAGISMANPVTENHLLNQVYVALNKNRNKAFSHIDNSIANNNMTWEKESTKAHELVTDIHLFAQTKTEKLEQSLFENAKKNIVNSQQLAEAVTSRAIDAKQNLSPSLNTWLVYRQAAQEAVVKWNQTITSASHHNLQLVGIAQADTAYVTRAKNSAVRQKSRWEATVALADFKIAEKNAIIAIENANHARPYWAWDCFDPWSRFRETSTQAANAWTATENKFTSAKIALQATGILTLAGTVDEHVLQSFLRNDQDELRIIHSTLSATVLQMIQNKKQEAISLRQSALEKNRGI